MEPTTMQRRMMKFAKLHDWGADAAYTDDGGVEVTEESVVVCTGEVFTCRVTFYGVNEMAEWAGY